MSDLDRKLANSFLQNLGINNSKIQDIANDASFRSYYRIYLSENKVNEGEFSSKNIQFFNREKLIEMIEKSFKNGSKSLILMYAPPKYENCRPFIKIDNMLIENGLKAPEILAFNEREGFLLLEDFGDNSFNKALSKNKNDEEKLYQYALDCLSKVQKINKFDEVAFYNNKLLLKEVDLFVDFYLQYEKNIKLTLDERSKLKKLWLDLFDNISSEKSLILRDYHADNLMLLKGDNNIEKVGLLDFQDAVIGSKAYDLVSILEDVRREVDQKLTENMLSYYIKIANIEKNSFLIDYEIFSLQRNIKILGVFARLVHVYNKKKYSNFYEITKKLIKNRLEKSGNKFPELKKILLEYI